MYFAADSAEIQSESAPVLASVVSILEKCPDAVLQIAGHTDSLGDANYNLYLSRERASAVSTYLVDFGIPTERLVSEGFGEAQPVADNATERGRSKNRRIEFSVFGYGTSNG